MTPRVRTAVLLWRLMTEPRLRALIRRLLVPDGGANCDLDMVLYRPEAAIDGGMISPADLHTTEPLLRYVNTARQDGRRRENATMRRDA